MPENEIVTIIGAGPAGIAAAIYLQRAGLHPLVLERDEIGGLLRNANLVENYPGFPEGISGSDLVNLLRRHLMGLNIRIRKETVTAVRRSGAGFLIEANSRSFESRFVVVASGTHPIIPSIRGLSPLLGKRIFSSIVELPKDAVGKKILILGGGDAAFDYALSLKERGHSPIVVSRSKPHCLPLLLARVRAGNIPVLADCAPTSIRSNKEGISLGLKARKTAKNLTGDLMILACGRTPNLDFLDRAILRRIDTTKGKSERIVDGLYLVGDAVGGKYRQTGIAVGNGLLAGMHIEQLTRKRRAKE